MSDRTQARLETSAGGVVVRCTGDGPAYLLILDSYRNWGFPKGHIDAGETPEAAARREIAEETGLSDLVLHRELSTIDWFFRFGGRPVHKHCHFFLFESRVGDPVPQVDEGITACRWAVLPEALDTIRYENARAVLEEAAPTAVKLCGG